MDESIFKNVLQLAPPAALGLGLAFIMAALRKIPKILEWHVFGTSLCLGGIAYGIMADVANISHNVRHPAILNAIYGICIGGLAYGMDRFRIGHKKFDVLAWENEEPPPAPPRKLKVLLVEDNTNDSLMFADALQKCCGLETTVVQTAEGAVELIKREKWDLIFVDMRLKYMQGWDLVPFIWQNSPESFVVVICGALEDVQKIPAPHRPFIPMAKPVDAAKLKYVLDRIRVNGNGH